MAELMLDGCGRVINYLRISVTDRCNFRCGYCMPPEGVNLLDSREVLSYEELLRVIAVLGREGVNSIRLTGGEPLVRKGLVDFIRSIRSLGTVRDLAMTTNGSLLGDMAHELKRAGLDRVNISIDTLDSERFARITGGGSLKDTLDGIEKAMQAGLSPVKLNVVLTEVLSRQDVAFFLEQVMKYPVEVRFIEYMPVGLLGVKPGASIWAVKKLISEAGFGALEPATTLKGSGPAKYYRLPQARGVFGFITPLSDHFCGSCNRIRLTADGKLKPCLLANREVDIKAALRVGGGEEAIVELFKKAVREKPVGHSIGDMRGGEVLKRGMSQVGG